MKLIFNSILFLFVILNISFAADSLQIQSFGPEYREYKINDKTSYYYKAPSAFEWITNIPGNYVDFYHDAFRSDLWPEYSLITGSTVLLWYYDQDLLDESQRFGRRIGLGNDEGLKDYISISGYPIFRGPSNVASAMYFIGDGWTHLSFSLGFYAAGLIGDDNRALQTASQIAQGMLTTGIMIQVLKHATGRESPFASTEPRGRWDLLPNQVEYHKHVPRYDAYPSGHLATATMTLTVIADNYPEYTFIKPVGYTMLGLLMYQMMNNGVHWASDYPLGFAIGYVFGKIAVRNGRVEVNRSADSTITDHWYDKIDIRPSVDLYGGMKLNFSYPLD